MSRAPILNYRSRLFAKIIAENPDILLSDAYKQAGYKPVSLNACRAAATKLWQKPEIQHYYNEMLEAKEKAATVTRDTVIQGFLEVATRCMQREPVLDSTGEPTGEWRFDSSGANRALQELGKLIGAYELDNHQKTPTIQVLQQYFKQELIE